jgi:hypothetical protein
MTSHLKYAVLSIVAVACGVASGQAAGIGDFTGTPTPEVVTPNSSPGPALQAPTYAQPQIGPAFVAPRVYRRHAYHKHIHR